MNRPNPAHFTHLVDWVEANPDTTVAPLDDLSGTLDADTLATVTWIRDFLEAGRLMPLKTPPDSVRNELRLAFRRYLQPRVPDEFLEAALSFDSRGHDRASGMRSTVAGKGRHLILENELLRLTLSVVPASDGEVDLQGHVLWRQDEPGYSELVFTRGGTFERAVRPDRDGHFTLTGVRDLTDEVWLSRGTSLMRARIDLAKE